MFISVFMVLDPLICNVDSNVSLGGNRGETYRELTRQNISFAFGAS